VDHAPITQASVVRFIEDNWLQGARLGGGSFDAKSASLAGLFDFGTHLPDAKLFLDPKTGEVLKTAPAVGAN
jgi:phospholipase C